MIKNIPCNISFQEKNKYTSETSKTIIMLKMSKLAIFLCVVLLFASLVSAAPGCNSCGSVKCACPEPAEEEPLQFSKNPLHGQTCTTHGDKQCLGDDFGHCNWGTWTVYDCGVGTACVPNDFECVPFSDWDRVNEQVNGPFSAAAPPEPQRFSKNPLHGQPCATHGEKQCLGDDFGHCNWGTWTVYDCGEGTSCVPNDYQCIPVADWDRVNEQVNGNKDNLGSSVGHSDDCSCPNHH